MASFVLVIPGRCPGLEFANVAGPRTENPKTKQPAKQVTDSCLGSVTRFAGSVICRRPLRGLREDYYGVAVIVNVAAGTALFRS